MKNNMVACMVCAKKFDVSDAVKLELLYMGKLSKNIVSRISYFHHNCFYDFLGKYWKSLKEDETLKKALEHKTPEKQTHIMQGLAFKAIMMELTGDLEDDLYDKADIKLKVSGKDIKPVDLDIKRNKDE